ncbi:hypothetical protein YE28_10535 [Salmonella enterica subsp. arizonae]|nr:hypothetical protein [Salmonella enterica]EAR7072693.1 hypothetical protein [Salmonella enterica]ECG1183339.1 hypothetical protein [Salmonella enterica subsp. arizonae]ECH9223796.1 hypothetical protein [Salmonella enterica subsp. arizonae]ECU0901670.1 hypothetical protein [Salmonella enterica]
MRALRDVLFFLRKTVLLCLVSLIFMIFISSKNMMFCDWPLSASAWIIVPAERTALNFKLKRKLKNGYQQTDPG